MDKNKLQFFLNIYRLIPAFIIISVLPDKKDISLDISRWIELDNLKGNRMYCISILLIRKKEFRNLIAFRIIKQNYILYLLFSLLFPKMNTLFIYTEEIGGGLYIQHGFSTIISAKSIGINCFINQQVTIGYEGNAAPIIGNDVRICAGAKVIGGCIVGDESIIGANAVVVKDVPPRSTVGGVPAKIIVPPRER